MTSLGAKGFTAPARRHLKECRRCVSASGKYDLIQGIFLFRTCQGLLLCTILGHFKCGQGGQWKETRKEGKGPQQSSMSFSVEFLSRVRLFVTPWTAARQASLSITNSRSLLKLMSIELVKPSNHLILCHPLLLPPSIFPSIRVFSNESALPIRWPKYWRFNFNTSPSSEY